MNGSTKTGTLHWFSSKRARLRERWVGALQFFGAATLRHLVVGAVVGVALFAIELGFAYALQSFLAAVGILPKTVTSIGMSAGDAGYLGSLGLWAAFAFLSAFGVARGFLQWVQAYYIDAIAEVQKREQRDRIIERAFVGDSANTAEIVSLFSEYATAAGFLTNHLLVILIRSTAAAFILVWMFWKAPWPTSGFLITMGTAGFIFKRFDRKNGEEGRRLLQEYATMQERLIVGIRNLLLLQIYGTVGHEQRLLLDRNEKYCDAYLRYSNNSGMIFAVPQIVGVVIIGLMGIIVNRTSELMPGELVTYFYVLFRLVQMISDVARNIGGVQFFLPRAAQVKQWVESKSSVLALQRSGGRASEFQEPVGWQLEAVDFAYSHGAAPVFENFSVQIPAGKITVLQGVSGSGKSTLIDLLIGRRAPQRGKIELLVGGQRLPLSEGRAQLYGVIGYVSSETFLIDGTLLENLKYGQSLNGSESDVQQALERAQCGFVSELPDGLQHRLTEQGAGLSAGQKQRLSLARALIRKPKVLILDEATSNLDRNTEQKLIQTLAPMRGTMTIVVITHRDPSQYEADHVIQL